MSEAFGAVLVRLLDGLSGASSLFLVGAGLSLIFGVSRIVNFAHGSFYMLGLYAAYSAVGWLGPSPAGFWGGVLLAAAAVALLGGAIEVGVLRRLYAAPELLQLLATFALVLVIGDAALRIWGPEDLLGPKAPGLRGAVEIFGRPVPQYDLLLVGVAPAVLAGLWLLLTRTRFGLLVRAATQDREMVAALGVDPKRLFTGVFMLGAFLAALGGALQLPREPASLRLDLAVIAEAFVVVVVGGMGSVPGAFLAALLISAVKAACIAAGTVQWGEASIAFSRFTLVAEFAVMALVLVWRPWGLLGRPPDAARAAAAAAHAPEPALQAGASRARGWAAMALLGVLALVPLAAPQAPYLLVLGVDILIAALFALSLHFIVGPGGMHSFGHAAYFGLGAYGAALGLRALSLPMEAALLAAPMLAALGALVFGWFTVRLSGIYSSMLTLAFAQIVWSVVFQWDEVTGGSNGLVGIWPAPWLASRQAFYWLTLALVALSVWLLARLAASPFGLALRAVRDSPLRARAIGIEPAPVQWAAFVAAGLFAGVAGALFAFAKGSISPEALGIGRSVDGLVMVLLGGVQSAAGPLAGATLYTWMQDALMRGTDYWRALLGGLILLLVMAFPGGVAGAAGTLRARLMAGRRQRGAGRDSLDVAARASSGPASVDPTPGEPAPAGSVRPALAAAVSARVDSGSADTATGSAKLDSGSADQGPRP